MQIKQRDPNFRLPDNIKVLKFRKQLKGYKLFKIYNNSFVYIKISSFQKGLHHFALTLMLWELSLSSILLLMVYYILKRFLKKEYAHKQFLDFILGLISHKFGNFLSIQRINLELIETENKKALQRLKEAYSFMEKDFKGLLEIIKNSNEDRAVRCGIKDTIEESLTHFSHLLKDKRVELSVNEDIHIRSHKGDFYNIIYELIENSIKYSQSYIHIKSVKKGRYVYIIFSNDISNKKSGSGFGLEIIKYLCRKNNFTFIKKTTKDTFQAALIVGV